MLKTERLSILGFSFFILALLLSPSSYGDTKSTVAEVAKIIAPDLNLQTGELPNASVNTDQCILAVDKDFQDGFDKDELNQYCSGVSLDAIPSDPLGMMACGDTDMALPDLKEESGKKQFCSMVGSGDDDDDDDDGFKKDLCELGRDLNCKRRAHKKVQNKIKCIEERLAELGQFMGQKLSPALEEIMDTAQERIKEYDDFLTERERQSTELLERQADMNKVMAEIAPILKNKFIASQADEFYRDFLKTKEQEKTQYAVETCMQKSVEGLKCGGNTNMTPYNFIICRAGEVASGIKQARKPEGREQALMDAGSAGVRTWLDTVLKFPELPAGGAAADASGAKAKVEIMDDVAFNRRLTGTAITFQEIPYVSKGKKGVARVRNLSQSNVITELKARLETCKTSVANDQTLKDRLIESEANAAKQYAIPMDNLATAYKTLIRTATGRSELDISMVTCDAGSLQVKRDCVYHLASQLRSAVSGDNESGHTNPFGRLDARALGLRTLPNPHTMFNTPLKSEIAFGGQNMTIDFKCRGIEQCLKEMDIKKKEFTKIITQGRAKLRPESSDMHKFTKAMKQQVKSAAAQISQITGAISKQWAAVGSELAALGAKGADLAPDAGESSGSAQGDKYGLPSISQLMAQAKSMGGMLKTPNPGTTTARDNLTEAREKVDEKYASLKTILSGYKSQVDSCVAEKKKEAFDKAIAACEKMPKVSTSLSDLIEWWQENGGDTTSMEAQWEKDCTDPGKTVATTSCVDGKRRAYVAKERSDIQKERKKAADLSNGVGDDGTDGVSCDQLALQSVKEYGDKYGSTGDGGGKKSTGGN